MSGYADSLEIEAKGRKLLSPFLEQRAHKGHLVWTTKGRLARELQRSAGDVLFNSDEETIVGCELKCEERLRDTLFIERWSNRKRWTPGWLETLSTDLLLYYFIEGDKLCVINFDGFRHWLYDCRDGCVPKAGCFPQYQQKRHSQPNDTWGYSISIDRLPARSVLVGVWNPQIWLRNADMVGAA